VASYKKFNVLTNINKIFGCPALLPVLSCLDVLLSFSLHWKKQSAAALFTV